MEQGWDEYILTRSWVSIVLLNLSTIIVMFCRLAPSWHSERCQNVCSSLAITCINYTTLLVADIHGTLYFLKHRWTVVSYSRYEAEIVQY